MGVEYYNQSVSGSSLGGGILYRPKPLTLTARLYGDGSNNVSSFPVWRSGASDKSFEGTTSTSITLYTTSSTGVRSVVASLSYGTYLSSGVAVAFHLNSADTCLYVLIGYGGSYRFIKINDTTGVVTTIGTAFTPATVANWGFGAGSKGSLTIDSVSGHLKFVCNGFYHLINKTTGAIVSQDTAISIGSFLASSVFYVTQDGNIGVTDDLGNASGGAVGFSYFSKLVHSSYGQLGSMILPAATTGLLDYQATTIPLYFNPVYLILVDNDKVCLSYALTNANGAVGAKYYLLSEFDKLVKSIADVGAGVI